MIALARSRILGIIIMVASLLAVGMAVYSNQRSRDYARCQSRYNEHFSERTRIITEVGADERVAERRRSDALDAAFLDPAILKPAEERTAAEQRRVRILFDAYIDAAQALKVERAKADRARAQNPVPPPPSQVCGA